MLSLLFALSLITPKAHAECAASCALLQSGRTTFREIRDETKLTAFDTILVSVLGPVLADDLDDARVQCEEKSRRFTWWHPAGETVRAVLYDDLQVFRQGSMNIVVDWVPQKACR